MRSLSEQSWAKLSGDAKNSYWAPKDAFSRLLTLKTQGLVIIWAIHKYMILMNLIKKMIKLVWCVSRATKKYVDLLKKKGRNGIHRIVFKKILNMMNFLKFILHYKIEWLNYSFGRMQIIKLQISNYCSTKSQDWYFW